MSTNQLLLGLPADEQALIMRQTTRMPLPPRQILYQPEQQITDLYFVESGVVSLIMDIINEIDHEVIGSEVGIIGSEGAVGLHALLFDLPLIPYRAIAQVAGEVTVLRLDPTVRDWLPTCPVFMDRCYRFIDLLMKQTAQVAGCNLRHTVLERLSRWLLMTRDRLDDDTLPLTQDFLAIMLGVRRPGVSLAVNTLQAAGLVQHSRGRITITDADGLEEASCHCYKTIKTMYELSAIKQSPIRARLCTECTE